MFRLFRIYQDDSIFGELVLGLVFHGIEPDIVGEITDILVSLLRHQDVLNTEKIKDAAQRELFLKDLK